jgi:hypothetical protein
MIGSLHLPQQESLLSDKLQCYLSKALHINQKLAERLQNVSVSHRKRDQF